MVFPPNSMKDISCLRVNGRFPPTYIYQSKRTPKSSPPPLIQLKSKMPKQNDNIADKSKTISISESQVSSEQQPIIKSQNQSLCFSSKLTIKGKVRLRRILQKTSTRKEMIQSDTKPVKMKYKTRKVHPTHICRICRDITDKHKYYGGHACNSCTLFFKQAVQTQCNLTYFCIREKTCKISSKTRKFCNYCRYQACLAAGMRTDWVSESL